MGVTAFASRSYGLVFGVPMLLFGVLGAWLRLGQIAGAPALDLSSGVAVAAMTLLVAEFGLGTVFSLRPAEVRRVVIIADVAVLALTPLLLVLCAAEVLRCSGPRPTYLLMLATDGAILWLQARPPHPSAEHVAAAARLGLRYSTTDSLRVGSLPFDLFRKPHIADAPKEGSLTASAEDLSWELLPFQLKVENLMWGSWHELAVTSFELRSYLGPQWVREQAWISCAMTTLPGRARHVVIERRGRTSYRTTVSAVTDVVELESLEFEDAYQVRCAERPFAVSVLDPALMGWLIDHGEDLTFELLDDRLLCYVPRRPISRIDVTLQALSEFRSRIPAFALATGSADPT
jgi:hypothetical protein